LFDCGLWNADLGMKKINNHKSKIKDCLQTQASSQRFFAGKGDVKVER